MRTPPVHCRGIQVSSPTGELKRISVSGLDKLRMLWLFRNFSILDFSVLTKKQQAFIAQMWHRAPGGRSAGSALQLIGCVEGFSPAPASPLPKPAASAPAAAVAKEHAGTLGKPARARINFRLSWTLIAAVVLLLGVIYLWPPHRQPPAVSQAQSPKQHLALQPPAAAPPPRVAALPPQEATAKSKGSPVVAQSANASPGLPKSAVSPPALPQAMARELLPETSRPARAPSLVAHTTSPEVLIRVRVDGQGRAESFEVMQGKGRKTAEAIAAAKRWSFRPCSGSDSCEHTLKFTDSGDTSHLQVID